MMMIIVMNFVVIMQVLGVQCYVLLCSTVQGLIKGTACSLNSIYSAQLCYIFLWLENTALSLQILWIEKQSKPEKVLV